MKHVLVADGDLWSVEGTGHVSPPGATNEDMSCSLRDSFPLDKRAGGAYKNGPYESFRPVIMISSS